MTSGHEIIVGCIDMKKGSGRGGKMESMGKKEKRQGIDLVSSVVKTLLVSYGITAGFLLLFSVLLYKFRISEEMVTGGIVGIYILSNFAGGFLLGKRMKTRKFLWGILSGFLYFLLMVLISFCVYHEKSGSLWNMAVTMILCTGSGMLGGMLS